MDNAFDFYYEISSGWLHLILMFDLLSYNVFHVTVPVRFNLRSSVRNLSFAITSGRLRSLVHVDACLLVLPLSGPPGT